MIFSIFLYNLMVKGWMALAANSRPSKPIVGGVAGLLLWGKCTWGTTVKFVLIDFRTPPINKHSYYCRCCWRCCVSKKVSVFGLLFNLLRGSVHVFLIFWWSDSVLIISSCRRWKSNFCCKMLSCRSYSDLLLPLHLMNWHDRQTSDDDAQIEKIRWKYWLPDLEPIRSKECVLLVPSTRNITVKSLLHF